MPRAKKAALRLGVVLFTLTLALAFAEAVARVVRDEPWYERVGAAAQDLSGLERQTVGRFAVFVRAPIPTTPKTEGTCRILFLGDSFTYGLGVEDVDDVFVSRVTARLNAARPVSGIRTYESFNGGMPGTQTLHWVRFFQEAVDRFHPDLVVTVFFIRDGTPDIASIQLIEKVRESMQRLVEESALFRYSHLYRALHERRAQLEFSRDYLRVMSDAYVGSEEETAEWQRAQNNLIWLRGQSHRRGIDFSIIIFPMLIELTDDHPLEKAMAEVERFSEDTEIPCASLMPLFRGEDPSALWVSPLDQHPNARAHAIAAEGVYRLVLERLRARYPGADDGGGKPGR